MWTRYIRLNPLRAKIVAPLLDQANTADMQSMKEVSKRL
jgi:hypothetical protein